MGHHANSESTFDRHRHSPNGALPQQNDRVAETEHGTIIRTRWRTMDRAAAPAPLSRIAKTRCCLFAVNCASIGCPALRPEAFTAAQLDAQLDDQTRRFLRDRTRNRYVAGDDLLLLSPIFNWYAGDFETGSRGSESVAAFVALYADAIGADPALAARLKADDVEIDYLDYDWALNAK